MSFDPISPAWATIHTTLRACNCHLESLRGRSGPPSGRTLEVTIQFGQDGDNETPGPLRQVGGSRRSLTTASSITGASTGSIDRHGAEPSGDSLCFRLA